MGTRTFGIISLCFTLLFTSCSETKEAPDKPIPPQPEEEFVTLRILTYNIFHAEATNGSIDLDLFAEIINEQKPDLVALQEVDNGTKRVGGIDITAELSKRTDLEGFFGVFRPYQGGEYGAAILSKLPVEEFISKPAFNTSEGVPRSLLYARVKVAEDHSIIFNSSHLSTIYEERSRQLDELADFYLADKEATPLIISGDLNAEPQSPEMERVLETFAVSDTKLNNTFSTRTGMRKKIDFVLYPNTDKWEVVETKRICRVDASDHCALLSVLRFKISE